MFQANYKDTQITLNEAVPVFFVIDFEHILFTGVLSEGTTWKNPEE